MKLFLLVFLATTLPNFAKADTVPFGWSISMTCKGVDQNLTLVVANDDLNHQKYLRVNSGKWEAAHPTDRFRYDKAIRHDLVSKSYDLILDNRATLNSITFKRPYELDCTSKVHNTPISIYQSDINLSALVCNDSAEAQVFFKTPSQLNINYNRTRELFEKAPLFEGYAFNLASEVYESPADKTYIMFGFNQRNELELHKLAITKVNGELKFVPLAIHGVSLQGERFNPGLKGPNYLCFQKAQ